MLRRMIAGAAAGLLLWLLCFLQLDHVPGAITFFIAAFAVVFGVGAPVLLIAGDDLPRPQRAALACAIGLALAPLLVCLLALVRGGAILPPIAFASAGLTIARWSARTPGAPPVTAEGRWYLLIPAIVFLITAWVSAGRMTTMGETVSLYGDYDTLDLTYYSAIASELTHATTLPPPSPFYAGHRIIYSYFPLALLGSLHMLTGVPISQAFLWFGWPFFTAVSSAMALALCRRLGSLQFAIVTTCLIYTGSGLAYLAAWWWPWMVKFDTLIWSSMFLGPSAEWLFFNPWAPTLAVLFAGLFALMQARQRQSWRWALISALCLAQLFMFKSFSFMVVVPAVGIAALVALARRDAGWRQLAGVAVGAGLGTIPWLMVILPFNRAENRGAVIAVDSLSLVRRMLFKTDLTGTLETFVHRFASDPSYRILLTLATLLFLIGGLGARCLGLVAMVRAAIGREPFRDWTSLAWIVILGVALPFFVSIQPFPNSIQTYMLGMFALWPFAVSVIWPEGGAPSPRRWMATAVLILLAIPATAHYVIAAHNAKLGTPLLTLDEGDAQVIRALRRTNPGATMVLHSNTLWPSMYAVESARRVVLGWSSYVGEDSAEVDTLAADIAAFFGSPSQAGTEDPGLLKRHRVTHVIERTATDRIHPSILSQLRLLTGTPAVRLYEVPPSLRR